MRRVLLLTLLVLGSASARLGARPAHAASEMERLLDQVGGADLQARYPAYSELLRRRDAGLAAPLLERIEGWDLGAQSYGVSLLQTVSADGATKAWDRLLGARGPFLRAVAAQQVHPRDPGRASKVLVEAIGQAKGDPAALQMILPRLGGMRDANVLAAVRGLVGPGSDPDVLASALGCLVNADDREVLPAVRALVREPRVGVRALAAALLLKHGEEDHAQVLATALEDDALAYGTFLRLRPWLEDGARVPPAVLDAALRRAERDPLGAYVAALIGFVARLEHAPAVPALRRLLKSAQPDVAKAAFEALATMPQGLTADDLRGELEGSVPSRRLAAADALRRRDDLSGLRTVLELARPGSPERREAVTVLGGFRVPEAVEPLLDAMLDDDISTRAHAFTALGNVFRALFPYRRLDVGSTGYMTNVEPALRAQAVARLRAWWQANREAGW
jgi:HEAT repeat protein